MRQYGSVATTKRMPQSRAQSSCSLQPKTNGGKHCVLCHACSVPFLYSSRSHLLKNCARSWHVYSREALQFGQCGFVVRYLTPVFKIKIQNIEERRQQTFEVLPVRLIRSQSGAKRGFRLRNQTLF